MALFWPFVPIPITEAESEPTSILTPTETEISYLEPCVILETMMGSPRLRGSPKIVAIPWRDQVGKQVDPTRRKTRRKGRGRCELPIPMDVRAPTDRIRLSTSWSSTVTELLYRNDGRWEDCAILFCLDSQDSLKPRKQ